MATALSTEAANAVQMRVEANMMGANLGQTHVGPLLGDCIQPMTYSPIFSSLGSRKVLSATETWIGCFQDLCYLYLMLSSHVFKKITGSLC